MSWWYRGAVCSYPLPAIADSGPVAQHNRHNTAPISRTRPSPRRLLLINRPRRDGTLSRRWYTAATGGSRTRDLAIAKSSLVPLGHRVPCHVISTCNFSLWHAGMNVDQSVLPFKDAGTCPDAPCTDRHSSVDHVYAFTEWYFSIDTWYCGLVRDTRTEYCSKRLINAERCLKACSGHQRALLPWLYERTNLVYASMYSDIKYYKLYKGTTTEQTSAQMIRAKDNTKS